MALTNFPDGIESATGFVGPLTGNVTGASLGGTPVAVTASTLAVTRATHAGRAILLNRAAGIAVTLPNATGTGAVYRFIIGTAITSNTTTIKVARAADAMQGRAYVETDTTNAVIAFAATAGTDDTVTLNGGTLGGLAGDEVVVTDVAANLFQVMVYTKASGTEATPFSNTVS